MSTRPRQISEERRQAVRARRILSIQFRVVKSRARGADRRWRLSTTHDISCLGLAFLSDIPVRVDDVLELHVIMSGVLDIFKGYARAVRVAKWDVGACYLVGVRFIPSYGPRKSSTARSGKRPVLRPSPGTA